MQLSPTTRNTMDSVFQATLNSPQVIAAQSSIKAARRMTKSGRATVPGQLTIAPWLGSPNGTTEEFLFIQSLDAGGRRQARVSVHDSNLLDAEVKYVDTLSTVYAQILNHLTQLAAAEREYALALHAEKNMSESLKVIEAQVNAGAKPGSDAELAKVVWNEAKIALQVALDRVSSNKLSLESFGLKFEPGAVSSAIPEASLLTASNLLERKAAVASAKLSNDMRSTAATGRPDVSMVVRSQNFTRNFTPNDRGIAVQFSIPIDHGTIKASTTTMATQLSTFESRVKDDVSKQDSKRKSLLSNITSLDIAISSSQTSVIAPLREYVARMQRAYVAGTVSVTTYLDAQRSLHDAELKVVSLRDQRDLATIQLVEQCGMLPSPLITQTKQSDTK